MNKYYTAILVGLLGTLHLPTLGMAQDVSESTAQGEQDVAQLLYPIIKQQIAVKKAYKDLAAASENYINDPSDANLTAFKTALANDIKAIQQYNALIATTKEPKIESAEKKFYEETPATKADIESGPRGESVAKEMKDLESGQEEKVVQQLKQDIREDKTFTEQLRIQAGNLKSVKERIENELQKPVAQSNPTAKQEDKTLAEILSEAINARRLALGEQ